MSAHFFLSFSCSSKKQVDFEQEIQSLVDIVSDGVQCYYFFVFPSPDNRVSQLSRLLKLGSPKRKTPS